VGPLKSLTGVGAGVAIVLLARALGVASGPALLLAGLVALAAAWLGLLLWHRRKTWELLELDPRTIGGWRRVHPHMAWPKECRHCGMTAHTWRAVKTHGDPAGSPCAARGAQIGTEPPAAQWVDSEQAGAVDTLYEPLGGSRTQEIEP
jgi:hypothetical protein